MKIFLGITIFVVSFLSGAKLVFNSKPVSLSTYQERFETIKDATVTMFEEDEKGIYLGGGTGTLVIKSGHKFILSNAHVCVNDFKQYVDGKKKAIGTRRIVVATDYKHGRYNFKQENFYVDFFLDYCLIYVGSSMPGYTYVDLDVVMPQRYEYVTYSESLVKKKFKKDQVMLFTRNRSDMLRTVVKKGDFLESVPFDSFITGKDKNDKSWIALRGPHQKTTLDAIPGDSGSAIFDESLNFKGIVYGSSFKGEGTIYAFMKEEFESLKKQEYFDKNNPELFGLMISREQIFGKK